MASCRTCGGELGPIVFCPDCAEGIVWKCASCNKETDMSVHTHEGKVFGPKEIASTNFAPAA